MGTEATAGKMEKFISDTGKTIEEMAKVWLDILMELKEKVCGKMTDKSAYKTQFFLYLRVGLKIKEW